MIPHVPKHTNITSSVILSPIPHTHHHIHLALPTPICMNAALLCFISPSTQAAVGHDHIEKVEAHASVTDNKKGFGGKFGVMSDRVDKVG